MAKDELLQIRVTPAQKKLLLSAAGDLSLSEYVLGQLFDLSPRLNPSPIRIKPVETFVKTITHEPPVENGVPFGKPWTVMGKQRSMFRRPDGSEYEGWL